MTSVPIVSVIIDTYNYGEYIEEAVNSALSQTLPRELYEVIVVDDGSTDDTWQRLRKYLPNIVYHYKENGGQASAFNAGIGLARGEFVAFLDADDYWQPDKLAKVLEKFRENEEVGGVFHMLSVVTSAGEELETVPQCFDSIAHEDSVQSYADWLTAIGVATSGISFRTAVVRSLVPIPDEFTICADAYLVSCASLVVDKFALLPRVLGNYRIHGKNCYSGLSANGKFVVKSEEIAKRYGDLLSAKRELLENKFGNASSCMSAVLRASVLKVKVGEVRQKEGAWAALQALWDGRAVLMQLPLKYRLFRIGSIFLQLFSPEAVYNSIKATYCASWLWKAVNRR